MLRVGESESEFEFEIALVLVTLDLLLDLFLILSKRLWRGRGGGDALGRVVMDGGDEAIASKISKGRASHGVGFDSFLLHRPLLALSLFLRPLVLSWRRGVASGGASDSEKRGRGTVRSRVHFLYNAESHPSQRWRHLIELSLGRWGQEAGGRRSLLTHD
ncbi:unnamed protein product [Musa acuminata subsp. burmannicoides]